MLTTCFAASVAVFAVSVTLQRSVVLDRDCLLAAATFQLASQDPQRSVPPAADIQEVRPLTAGEPIAAGSAGLDGNANFIARLVHAMSALARPGQPTELRCDAEALGQPVAVTIYGDAMTNELRRFALRFWLEAVAISAFISVCAFLLLNVALVQPMRRILQSMQVFRRNPELTPPFDAAANGIFGDDEISQAGVELALMQHELRGALWRQARAAALGTAVAKMSHDLRGVLSPAMLIADSLAGAQDPRFKSYGGTLLDVIERAERLIAETLHFVSDTPRQAERSPVAIGPLLRLVAANLAPERAVAFDLEVDDSLIGLADREHLLRVLSNLARNAAEAGARRIRVSAEASSMEIYLDIADDGPGLPPDMVDRVFRPFASSGKRGGTGLGLAISSDLMQAMGGRIALKATGRQGTVFRVMLMRHIPITV